MPQSRRVFLAASGLAVSGLAVGAPVSALSTPVASPQVGGTRLIAHAMGETEVPANPLRVVALDGPVLDACILFGIKPIGATTGVENAPWPEYLGDATAGIRNVGTIVEPDLELIASLKPDLIIGVKARHEEIFAQLSSIAPVVFSETHRSGWRESVVIFADALNRNAELPGIVDAFDTRCAEIAAALGDSLATTPVSIVRVYTDIIYAYQVGAFSGSVLAAVGFPRPDSQSDPDQLAIELSLEQIGEADAEIMFLTMYGDQATADLSPLVENPLWNSLSVVQNNRVYFVPDEYWMVAIGYIAANRILDDLVTYLIDGAAPLAIPTV